MNKELTAINWHSYSRMQDSWLGSNKYTLRCSLSWYFKSYQQLTSQSHLY